MQNIAKKKTYVRAKILGYSWIQEYHVFPSVFFLLSFLREKLAESGKLTIRRGIGEYADRYEVSTESGEIVAEFHTLPIAP
jgi:hypothetical protein